MKEKDISENIKMNLVMMSENNQIGSLINVIDDIINKISNGNGGYTKKFEKVLKLDVEANYAIEHNGDSNDYEYKISREHVLPESELKDHIESVFDIKIKIKSFSIKSLLGQVTRKGFKID